MTGIHFNIVRKLLSFELHTWPKYVDPKQFQRNLHALYRIYTFIAVYFIILLIIWIFEQNVPYNFELLSQSYDDWNEQNKSHQEIQ